MKLYLPLGHDRLLDFPKMSSTTGFNVAKVNKEGKNPGPALPIPLMGDVIVLKG